jgi:translation initiation factor 2 subunit 2
MSDDYKKLLKEAREQLPKKVFKKERFETPSFSSSIIGNRTLIRNFLEVANKIRRDPEHLLKYLEKELASPAHIEERKAMFQGKFGAYVINTKLEKYIKIYVLCPECDKPDTVLKKDDRLLFIKCEACGARKPVPVIR